MNGVDHQAARLAFASGQPAKMRFKILATPADEAVVEGFERAALGTRISPATTVIDDVDNAAGDAPIVRPRRSVRKRNQGAIRWMELPSAGRNPPWQHLPPPSNHVTLNSQVPRLIDPEPSICRNQTANACRKHLSLIP
jgi:hypothetical protein